MFKDEIADIRAQGEREVVLAGRPFRIRREFLDDVAEQKLLPRVDNLRRAVLVLHSPSDDTVGIDNATRIFLAAKHPKSFVSLADADHLLTRRGDAIYAAHVIAAWAERYVDAARAEEAADMDESKRLVVVSETREGKFQQSVTIGPHHLVADEPVAAGGLDSGPSPYEWLIAGLGACTAMTLRLYAEQKKLPLERVTVTLSHAKIHAADSEDLRDEGGHARPHRAHDCDRGPARRGAARPYARDRGPLPGAPHAHVGDRYPHDAGRLMDRVSLRAQRSNRDPRAHAYAGRDCFASLAMTACAGGTRLLRFARNDTMRR